MEPKNNEARIKKAIFCNYDKSARPTLTDGLIKLKFKMIVKGFNFDSTSNKLTVSTWLAMVMTAHDTHDTHNRKMCDMRTARLANESFRIFTVFFFLVFQMV